MAEEKGGGVSHAHGKLADAPAGAEAWHRWHWKGMCIAGAGAGTGPLDAPPPVAHHSGLREGARVSVPALQRLSGLAVWGDMGYGGGVRGLRHSWTLCIATLRTSDTRSCDPSPAAQCQPESQASLPGGTQWRGRRSWSWGQCQHPAEPLAPPARVGGRVGRGHPPSTIPTCLSATQPCPAQPKLGAHFSPSAALQSPSPRPGHRSGGKAQRGGGAGRSSGSRNR